MTHNHRRRRRTSVCHLHPSAKPTTGFCASCLRERLATIEAQSPSCSSSSAVQAPQLRRARSYSARDASAAVFEQPRRRSCDVRSGGSSLHELFAVHDEEGVGNPTRMPRVPDLKEEEEEEEYEDEEEEEEIKGFDNGEEKKLVDEDSDDGGGEYKTMKEFIDLEWGNHNKKNNGRDLKEIASVLGKKLRKLSLKHQKIKRKLEDPDAGFTENGEIGSEVGEHGLGRRSCDLDPRLSLDTGGVSFEEPRASWDGCLVGKTYPKLTALASVTEDAKASPENKAGFKNDEEEKNPGGSAQTRDYYSDSRRRRSFDRSSSVKRPGSLEADELKAISNTKVSPETVGLFHGAKLLVTEKELRDSNWYSIKNYKPEDIEYGSNAGEVKQDGFGLKKPRRKWPKGWSIWGLMQKKKDTKNEVKAEKSLKLEGNVIEGSLAESLLKLRRVAKGEANGDVSEKLIRSYSVSARKSCDGVFHGATINGFESGRSSCDGLFHGSSTSVEAGRSSCDGLFHGIEGKGFGEKSKESHLLRKGTITSTNTGMYSPNNLENGLLRFYLTPLRSHKMSKSGKSRLMNSSSILGSAV